MIRFDMDINMTSFDIAPTNGHDVRPVDVVHPVATVPPADILPPWLNDLERAVYEAASDTLVSAKYLARRAGYCDARVREAISRLTGCDPPLLMRGRGGVRRVPRKAAGGNVAQAVALLRQAIQLLPQEGGGG